MGEFVRDHLPEPEGYFQSQGLVLAGRGRWRTTRCTFHGGSDSMRINTASGGWCCMSCGEHGGDVLAFHMQVHGLDFVTAARELGAYVEDGKPRSESYRDRTAKPALKPVEEQEHERLSDFGHQLWRDACALRNTVGADYLKARGCVLPPEDGDLRFHPALRHSPTGYVGPALLALVTDVVTREAISLHRTWIEQEGTKPAHLGHAARMNLKGHRKQGGVIRLWPDEAVSTGLAVAEGIETALSMARDYTPVWSVIDAPNLSALPVLAGIEWLVIGADNDPKQAGIKAATTCGERWSAAGAEVLVVMPEVSGSDWNDMEAA